MQFRVTLSLKDYVVANMKRVGTDGVCDHNYTGATLPLHSSMGGDYIARLPAQQLLAESQRGLHGDQVKQQRLVTSREERRAVERQRPCDNTL